MEGVCCYGGTEGMMGGGKEGEKNKISVCEHVAYPTGMVPVEVTISFTTSISKKKNG